MALTKQRAKAGRPAWWIDAILLAGLFFFTYAIIGVALEWTSPYRPKTEISLSLVALIHYAFLSLMRVSAGYVVCLVFTFTYGYVAAKSRWGDTVLIPILDILQSIPVLGFMPGLVLALVGLFPHTNLGLELAAILMIFTGQGWNMVFSFYTSLKSVPQELRELASLCQLNRLQVLRNIEIPFATNGLLWNSMLSMAGGWFFLMTIESFSLGDRDFRLPGVGAYMAVAYEQGDVRAILYGVAVMSVLVILVDRCVWSPLVAWSERFRFGDSQSFVEQRSVVLDWLNRSSLVTNYVLQVDRIGKNLTQWRGDRLRQYASAFSPREIPKSVRLVIRGLAILLVLFFIWFSCRSVYRLLFGAQIHWLSLFRDTLYTLLRVLAATVLGTLWTVPLGVFVGLDPRWTRRLQPVVQIVASFPAPMLFPAIVYVLLNLGVQLGWGSIILMLFSSQWYILFNVISGARLIPRHLLDLGEIFQVRGFRAWRAIILPGIFPSLVNGWITAAGGAWNATIVSEFVLLGNQQLSTVGIGATITRSAQQGDFGVLAASLLIMVTTVILINRFLWGSLFRIAESRFRLET